MKTFRELTNNDKLYIITDDIINEYKIHEIYDNSDDSITICIIYNELSFVPITIEKNEYNKNVHYCTIDNKWSSIVSDKNIADNIYNIRNIFKDM